MKIRILLCVLFLVLMLPLMESNLRAQTGHEFVANIPFEFTVCNERLPAGKYTVQPISSGNPQLLMIGGHNNQSIIMTCGHDMQMDKPSSTGRLIFNRYGNQYFLAEMWVQGALTGTLFVKSAQENAVIGDLGIKKRGRVTIKVKEVKPDR